MAPPPKSFRVVGIHPVIPSPELFQQTLEWQWGGDDESGEASANVRKHFAGLYLIEIAIDPPNAEINWSEITQPVKGQPRSNWQAPYDEREVSQGNWAFFLHFVDLKQPLYTEAGQFNLPNPTPMPSHLTDHTYEPP